MRVYTNIPLEHPCLKELGKAIGKRNIVWKEIPAAISCNLKEQFRTLKRWSGFFAEERVSFIVVSIDYDFEGHVDHSDLYSGKFTYCENLCVVGFLPDVGLFERRKEKTRTNLDSREGGYDYVPRKECLDVLFGYLKDLIPRAERGESC